MKKTIFSMLLILCVSNIHSQESTNLLFQFYGYKEDPVKSNYIKSLKLGNIDNAQTEEINEYFELNKDEICWSLDMKSFEEFLVALGEKYKINEEKSSALFGQLMNIAAQTVANIQQAKTIEKQEEAARKEQQRAEFQAMQAENKQKYAEFQAMTNRKVHSSDYQSNVSSYRTQGSYNDMLTSDPNRNMAVQQSVQQYGVNATRNAINQANAYDAQSRSTGGYGGQVISAVTSNRQALKIQVRDRKIGGRIVAYSLGGNTTGQQQWRPTDGIINKCTSNMEYQYTAYLQGVGNIYFDL